MLKQKIEEKMKQNHKNLKRGYCEVDEAIGNLSALQWALDELNKQSCENCKHEKKCDWSVHTWKNNMYIHYCSNFEELEE